MMGENRGRAEKEGRGQSLGVGTGAELREEGRGRIEFAERGQS